MSDRAAVEIISAFEKLLVSIHRNAGARMGLGLIASCVFAVAAVLIVRSVFAFVNAGRLGRTYDKFERLHDRTIAVLERIERGMGNSSDKEGA